MKAPNEYRDEPHEVLALGQEKYRHLRKSPALAISRARARRREWPAVLVGDSESASERTLAPRLLMPLPTVAPPVTAGLANACHGWPGFQVTSSLDVVEHT